MKRKKLLYISTLVCMLAPLSVSHASSQSLAQTIATISSSETINDGCMQDIAGYALNCTANDVQIAAARNIVILDDGCAYPGDTVDFTATFDVVVTAKERYDIGLYFATDGDSNNDGAVSGQCAISTPDYQPDPPFLDLDGTSNDPEGIVQDSCGDIDKAHNPLTPTITLTGVACIDPDGDGKLNLPNCTSWRQSGANELCTSPLEAFPGSPSKCRCDQDFNIDIDVPPASINLVKTATPSTITEPGGAVRFDVTVNNPGIDPNNSLTINSLSDDIYGDITLVQGSIVDTDCSVPQVLAGNGGSYSCAFYADVSGNAGFIETDTVTATGVDERGNEINGSDSAVVTLEDEVPTLSMVKTASPTEVLEPGGEVNFTVAITNTSVSSDPVTLTSLVDDIHGNLDGQGDCSVPQTLQSGDSYSCSFSVYVSGNAGESETDVITVSGIDDDDTPVSAMDSATVNVNDVPSMVEIIKTASPTAVEEPGGDVTFTFTVNNTSDQGNPPSPDSVTISSLTDSIYGDLNGKGDCSVPQTIASGASYSCSFSTYVAGNAAESETNIVTIAGTDDDGNPVSDNDDATVTVNNTAPDATLSKSAISAIVTFQVVVSNTSNSEDPLTLTGLSDDIYGDITTVHDNVLSTTCQAGVVIQPEADYSCTFEAAVNAPGEVDTVTGTATDDDGSAPIERSDSASVTLE